MDWLAALIVGLGLPVAATAVGLAWRAGTGRLRQVSPPANAGSAGADGAMVTGGLDPAELGVDPSAFGDRATLVQFSTEYCSRCPATARQLAGVAADYVGVRHVEVDLTRRADLATAFDVRQTPTTLIVGAGGATTARIGGVPRLDAVRTHLDTLTRRRHVAA